MCSLCCDRVFKDGIKRIFVAAVDIGLNVGESREFTSLRGMGHHWPASCCTCQSHPCRSEPTIDKDKGSPAEYDCHGKNTEDNCNESATYTSGHNNAPKSHAGVKKHVVRGKKSLVILSPPQYPHLKPHGLTLALTPLC